MESNFLQSSEWEEIQRGQGRKIWRVCGALVVRHDLLLGFNYLYAPRPAIDFKSEKIFFAEAEKLAQKERSIFLKIDPVRAFQFLPQEKKTSFSLQPCETIVCDLTQSEDGLLKSMHKKTRYNIRLAEKKGVQIINQKSGITGRGNDGDVFWRLLKETAERDGFHLHEKEYYRRLLEVRSDFFSNELFFAEYEGKPIAAALINFYRSLTSGESIATYLHGASISAHREVMAPHLLHWRIMQEAKKRGFVRYDFWGIDEDRWPGVTRFKKGFGGRTVAYPESFDIIYRKNYYQVFSFLRTHF